MLSKQLIFVSCLLAMAAVHADEPLACRNSLATGLDEEVEMAGSEGDDDGAIELAAGEFEASFGSDPVATMSGGVLLRRGNKPAAADQAEFDADRRAVFLNGNVRYEDPGTQVRSDSAEFNNE